MDKKKFSVVATELKDLTSDFGFAETFKVKDFIANLIIAKAREIVALADEGKEKPVKSETPFHCVVPVIEHSILEQSPDKKVSVANCVHYSDFSHECEPRTSSVKSEMPCNCNCAEKPKTLQEIINDVKAQLTDNQTYAVIVFRVDDTDTR